MNIIKTLSALALALILACATRPLFVNAAVDYNQKINFVDDFDSCSGERVLISGVQHIVGRTTTDGTERTRFVFTRNLHGAGQGYDSGTEYLLIDTVYQSSVEFTPGQAQFIMQEYHARLIQRGESVSGDDTLIHFLTKIYLDANGNLVTSIEIQGVSCQ